MVRIASFSNKAKLRSSPRSINFGCSRASRSSAAAARLAAAIAAIDDDGIRRAFYCLSIPS